MADYCRNNILGVRICMQVLKCALPKFPEQLLWTSQSTDKLVTFRISEITKILEYLHCTKTLVLHSRFQKQTNKQKTTNQLFIRSAQIFGCQCTWCHCGWLMILVFSILNLQTKLLHYPTSREKFTQKR